MTEREHLPQAIRRQLRREAYFGCCRCGFPFIEFHHIRGHSTTGHDPAHIMALCRNCHGLATAGALAETDQYRWKTQPHNRRHGFANGQLFTSQRHIVVALGTNFLAGPGYKLVVDGETLLELRAGDGGELSLTISFYDAHDNLVFLIEENEWITGEVGVRDVVSRPNHVQITDAKGSCLFEIDSRRPPLRLRGTLQRRGHRLDVGGAFLAIPQPWRYVFIGMAFFDAGFFFTTEPQELKIGNIIQGVGHPYGLRALSDLSSPLAAYSEVTRAYTEYCRGHLVDGGTSSREGAI